MARGAIVRSRRCDRRFSDDEIFTVLRAGDTAGADLAEICAGHGVTIPTYCLWKARYGALTRDELVAARGRERQRDRLLRYGSAAALVAVILALAVVLWPGGLVSTGPSEAVAAARPAPPVPAIPEPDAPHTVPASHPGPASDAGAAAAAAREAPPSVDPPVAETEPRFAVQVAAEPDLQLAGAILRRLEASGYNGYILPTTAAGVDLYRVRIGPYETQGEALAVARRLAGEGYEGAWLAR